MRFPHPSTERSPCRSTSARLSAWPSCWPASQWLPPRRRPRSSTSSRHSGPARTVRRRSALAPSRRQRPAATCPSSRLGASASSTRMRFHRIPTATRSTTSSESRLPSPAARASTSSRYRGCSTKAIRSTTKSGSTASMAASTSLRSRPQTRTFTAPRPATVKVNFALTPVTTLVFALVTSAEIPDPATDVKNDFSVQSVRVTGGRPDTQSLDASRAGDAGAVGQRPGHARAASAPDALTALFS